MKAVVAPSDGPTPQPDHDSQPLRPPASRGRFAAVAIVCGLLAGGLLFLLLMAEGGWPALVLCLSLGVCFSSIAAMLVFRRVQVPLEAAHGVAMAREDALSAAAEDDAAVIAPPPAPSGMPYAEVVQLVERLGSSEQRADRLRAQITAIATATDDALLLLGPDGRIERATSAAAELIGDSADALIDRPFAVHFPLYDNLRPEPLQHPLSATLLALLADPRAESLAFSALLERRGRTSVPLRLLWVPLATQDGARGALLRLQAPVDGEGRATAVAAPPRGGLDELLRRIAAVQDEAGRDGSRHGLLLIAPDRPGERLGLPVAEQQRWLVEQTVRDVASGSGPLLTPLPGLLALLMLRSYDAAIAARAEALVAAVAALPPALADDDSTRTGLRVGFVSIDGTAVEPEAWLDAAHAALREAQRNPGEHRLAGRLHPAEAGGESHDAWLRRKLDTRAVRLVAQAILPADGVGEPAWTELLPRIEDDDGVWVPIEPLAAALARLDLAATFDLAVVDTALEAGLGERRVLLRLSSAALALEGMIDALTARLARSRLAVRQLSFAIDEATALAWPRQVALLRERLLPLGVDLVLDACLGVQTLAALRLMPAQAVRLHAGLLVRGVGDGIDRAQIEALVNAARTCGVATIAGGVRDADLRERLRLARVDYVQGSAVSPPTPYSA